MNGLKYLSSLSVPLIAWFSFTQTGWISFLPFVYIFGFIPFLELFLPANSSNPDPSQERRRLNNLLYDLQLYLMVPLQLITLWLFLNSMQDTGLQLFDKAGRIVTMGLCCGIMGINVGHELGHRFKTYEKWMAKISLMTSLNMHFMNEHNNHHHKAVSTPEDPASARYGEMLFSFWFRSIFGVYRWAWKLESDRLKRASLPFLSHHNEMIRDHILQFALIAGIALLFNLNTALYFILAALIGHLVLETVNYIEHYGLRREKIGNRYEKVSPQHSWNSDHSLGRMLLFELSRHSDHHYRAGRKYQILRHLDESPQMPTGYPGMMVLSTIPPLWFWVMNKRVAKIEAAKKSKESM